MQIYFSKILIVLPLCLLSHLVIGQRDVINDENQERDFEGAYQPAAHLLYVNAGMTYQRFEYETDYSQFDSSMLFKPTISLGYLLSADFGHEMVNYSFQAYFSYFFPVTGYQVVRINDIDHPVWGRYDLDFNSRVKSQGFSFNMIASAEFKTPNPFLYISAGCDMALLNTRMNLHFEEGELEESYMTLEAFAPDNPNEMEHSNFTSKATKGVIGPYAGIRYEFEKFDLNFSVNYLFSPLTYDASTKSILKAVPHTATAKIGICYPLSK